LAMGANDSTVRSVDTLIAMSTFGRFRTVLSNWITGAVAAFSKGRWWQPLV